MNKVETHSLFTEYDVWLFRTGKHQELYNKFGSHITEKDGVQGTYFAVWAPSAEKVGIMGNFNSWDPKNHQLFVRWDESGIWEGFIPGLPQGELYKYKITSRQDNQILEKSDPYGFFYEVPPKTSSISWDLDYDWNDLKWMETRKSYNALGEPLSVYEIHLSSWRKNVEEDRSLTYREAADQLAEYIHEMGYTHVEFLPIMQHPYEPSWGYQVTGYFAPSSRHGCPQDFMYLVDKLHQNGIGVILDWVPAHFPSDAFALANFDGSNLYEHPDHRKGYHPDWKSMIFNFERNEVRSFLISNAIFWLDKYHIDGLRVDAVASIIYLDYSRNEGEWEPNEFGGNENLASISLLQEVNVAAYSRFPDIQMIAEESTAYPKISRPTYDGGMGFSMKWMMGWMHDTLNYFKLDPLFRKYHHNQITFSIMYAFTENFVLPLSHDEVVYGKGSIFTRMPGEEWQKFANLRLLYSYMFTHPGAKLLFMGNDLAQGREWNFRESLDWHLLDHEMHQGVNTLIKILNKLYRRYDALHRFDFEPKGFEWIDFYDSERSIIIYLRKWEEPEDSLLVICNFTPESYEGYLVGVPLAGTWKLLHNSDDKSFGGTGFNVKKTIKTKDENMHNRAQSVSPSLPPLSCLVYRFSKTRQKVKSQ